MRIGFWDIGKNVSKFDSPNQTFEFWHILTNISGSDAYFSNMIFVLKPWDQASRFEYNEPCNQKNWGVPEEGLPDQVESWNSYICMFNEKISLANSESNFGFFWPPLIQGV